jgi:hypothetical protein
MTETLAEKTFTLRGGLVGAQRARKCKGLSAQTAAAALNARKEHFPVVANSPRDEQMPTGGYRKDYFSVT